jgi:hypothetical protein
LSRFNISRRLIHANYKQFYIHEKSEFLRIKIKSNRSKFADDSNAKSFKCVTTLFKTRKKKMLMKNEKNRLWFVQKFDDQRELLQNIVLHLSFDDRFEFFARVRHDVIIVDVDVFKQLISIVHQRIKHYDMFRRLIVSIASTKNRLHVEDLTTMKKTRKIDFFDANLSC